MSTEMILSSRFGLWYVSLIRQILVPLFLRDHPANARPFLVLRPQILVFLVGCQYCRVAFRVVNVPSPTLSGIGIAWTDGLENEMLGVRGQRPEG